MNTISLSKIDIEKIIPNCTVLGDSLNGGQKTVFPCDINGVKCAVKFILLNNLSDDMDGTIALKIESIKSRVEREINIMRRIDSPNVVKMSSLELSAVIHNNQNLLFYSEEWIDGENIADILTRSKLCVVDTIKLGRDIVIAIDELWKLRKVHRDIKPQNIIKRACDGTNVLLDLGLAFDLYDRSLTQFGCIPGTKLYFSPEQLDYMHKKDLDFRSDIFSLGVVLYRAITGIHPFYEYGITDNEFFTKIVTQSVVPPNIIDASIPKPLSDIICRMLNKQPNGRYRKCSILINEFNQLLEGMEESL